MRTLPRALAAMMSLHFLISPYPVRAADRCPTGVKKLSRQGGDGEVSWSSHAVLPMIREKDWCYSRTVVLHKPDRQYVNWPKGEIHKKTIEREMTTWACCYPDPRAEDGELEHGYSGKVVPTQVYRGVGEPQQNQAWVSITGFIYLEPRTVRVDLSLRSGFRKTPDGFEYLYEIGNQGDKLTAVWNAANSEFFTKRIKEFDLSFPMKLRAESGSLKFSDFSKKPPEFRSRELLVLTEDGKEVFRMLAPAYIPK